MWEIVAAQIVTLRAMIGVMQAQVEALEATVTEAMQPATPATPTLPETCPHLETEESGTFGATETRCVACKQIV